MAAESCSNYHHRHAMRRTFLSRSLVTALSQMSKFFQVVNFLLAAVRWWITVSIQFWILQNLLIYRFFHQILRLEKPSVFPKVSSSFLGVFFFLFWPVCKLRHICS